MSFTNAIDEDYKPAPIKLIRDEEVYASLYDPNFEPIIVSLREGPLTIEELTRRYNSYIEAIGRAGNLTQGEVVKRQKTEMSIYRYLKDLEQLNIVVQAGRQIEPGKTTTKALYGRTATMFFPILKTLEWWDSQEAKEFVDIQAALLQLYLPNAKILKPKLKKLMMDLDSEGEVAGAKIFEENQAAVSEIIKGMSFKDLDKHLQRFSYLITLFESERYLNELKDCCST